ncbi:thiamine diphosphokinase [Pseudooceanicola sp.]|uniref:thiamine diphosphokinase n=1 Tax=Pseudooceanicola sp. TaxID=1914328 RepID=UPI0035C71B95
MIEQIVTTDEAVLLLGGADPEGALDLLRGLKDEVPVTDMPVVCADSGAALARRAGLDPVAVIGDFDSILSEDRAALDPARLYEVDEQESTDFDKALARIGAPVVLGVGFTGGRLDHQLAVMTGLALQPDRPCVLVGEEDVICLCPPRLSLELPVGSRLSLYPLAEMRGTSQGLEWPIDGLPLRPDGRVGTSNRVSAATVELTMQTAAMLLILPRPALLPLLAALSRSDARWPARAE